MLPEEQNSDGDRVDLDTDATSIIDNTFDKNDFDAFAKEDSKEDFKSKHSEIIGYRVGKFFFVVDYQQLAHSLSPRRVLSYIFYHTRQSLKILISQINNT